GAEVGGLAAALLLGLVAGLILNVMPCVLPVVALKLAPLMAGGGDEALREVRRHALFFGLGIECSFLALAGMLAATGLAWGEMFQQPAVVLVLAAVVFALGLSLFGVFHLPVLDLRFAAATKNPRLRALFTGMLATLLATPCSGPLLGGVLSWTLSRPAVVIVLVLAGVGAGMALPYAALAVWPRLARLLPRPGAWTGRVEQAVGLFLMGTCLYLLVILPPAMLPRALAALLTTAVGAWLWGLGGVGLRELRPLAAKAAGAAVALAAILWALNPPVRVDPWEPFDPQFFTNELGREPLMVDFTADWCPTCQALSATVLTDAAVAGLEAEYGVRAVRADLTEDFPAAEALLQALGARSIPVLAIFPAGEAARRPIVLRDLFTAGQLRRALGRARTEGGLRPSAAPGASN
ncbi:MAG: protein-disulfide reductase DsbD family protein, partial [Desulfovibrionaceae bacterium]